MMVVVMMMVVMVIMTSPRRHDHDAAAVMMMVVVVMMMSTDDDLRELYLRLTASRALLLVYRLQHGGSVRDGLQKLRVGVGLQHVACGWHRRGLSR